ncbi:MAG: hypothetical protein ACD_12C00523G0002 [uncultured bacterium]|nr:MAG: hypothetical protein ACD_12C00523G0002 [uncultured bacterium]
MKYKINKDLLFERKGKKVTIFDPEKSTIILMNETGSFILNQIKKDIDIHNIVNILGKKYNQTEKKLYRDTAIFLKELKKLKIII